MRDDVVKSLIIVAVVGLVVYWGITGFDITANWVALVGPIIIGYLFKPTSNSKKEDKDADAANDIPETTPNNTDVGDSTLRIDINYLCYSLCPR